MPLRNIGLCLSYKLGAQSMSISDTTRVTIEQNIEATARWTKPDEIEDIPIEELDVKLHFNNRPYNKRGPIANISMAGSHVTVYLYVPLESYPYFQKFDQLFIYGYRFTQSHYSQWFGLREKPVKGPITFQRLRSEEITIECQFMSFYKTGEIMNSPFRYGPPFKQGHILPFRKAEDRQ